MTAQELFLLFGCLEKKCVKTRFDILISTGAMFVFCSGLKPNLKKTSWSTVNQASTEKQLQSPVYCKLMVRLEPITLCRVLRGICYLAGSHLNVFGWLVEAWENPSLENYTQKSKSKIFPPIHKTFVRSKQSTKRAKNGKCKSKVI